MPCPELVYAGVLRPPQTKNQYDNVMFRRRCRKIAEELANQVQEYEKCGIKLKLVLGVDGSPSCGVSETSGKDSGILVEELRLALDERRISVLFYGVHCECLKDDLVKIKKYVE